MMRRLIPILLVTACSSSSSNDGPPIQVVFPAIDVAPGDEFDTVCQSFTLDNDEPIHVNAVVMSAGVGWHHSNWFWVPESYADGPDGTWNCADRGFDEVDAALIGGILYAQSTQSRGETQQFHEGAAIVIPPRSRVMGDVHLVNASSDPLSTALALELKTIKRVSTRMRDLVLIYRPLSLPPQRSSRFTARCDSSDVPLDFSLHYALSHYHSFGTAMRARAGGAQIFESTAGLGEPMGAMLDPPADVRGATTFEFECDYMNTTDATVPWGNRDGEMCMMLAFTDSEWRWFGRVVSNTNAVVGTDGTGVILNEGPCLWDPIASAD